MRAHYKSKNTEKLQEQKSIPLSSPSDPVPSENQYYQSLHSVSALIHSFFILPVRKLRPRECEVIFPRSHSWLVAELGARTQVFRLPVPGPELLWVSCLLRELCLPK